MTRATWVEGAAGSGHDVDHLPWGVVGTGDGRTRLGVRVGDLVLDVAAVTAGATPALAAPSLLPLMAAGPRTWETVRRRLVDLLTDPARRPAVEPHLRPVGEVTVHLPFAVADYVDFYCSLDHARNVGAILRPGGEPLPSSWRHLPMGYHGRSGTVIVSGTDVVRPCGQRLLPGDTAPTYGPSTRLDLEAELGFVVGTPSARGERVATSAFADHVFGVVLLNDWSARDVQSFEYVPLGPFLGKSFATSVAGWVTPLAALEAARVDLPGQDPEPAGYLRVGPGAGYDVTLEVEVAGETVAWPPYASTYWSPAQMLAHLTANGAGLRTGDLFASGTVSGPRRDQRGSLLELSEGGTLPVGSGARTFLRDGDTVTLRATAPGTLGARLTLGEVTGTVLPARH